MVVATSVTAFEEAVRHFKATVLDMLNLVMAPLAAKKRSCHCRIVRVPGSKFESSSLILNVEVRGRLIRGPTQYVRAVKGIALAHYESDLSRLVPNMQLCSLLKIIVRLSRKSQLASYMCAVRSRDSYCAREKDLKAAIRAADRLSTTC